MLTRLLGGFAGLSLAVAMLACGEDSNDPKAASGDGAGGDSTAGAGGGVAGSGTGGGVGGAACDDSGPDPTNHTAGTCSNLGETALVAYCNEAIATLDPGVAYAAISCLAVTCLRGPPCTADEYRDRAQQCLFDALTEACPDAGADATCNELETLCEASAAECHALLDGMTEATRAEVLTCAQADCAAGLDGCVQDVLTPD